MFWVYLIILVHWFLHRFNPLIIPLKKLSLWSCGRSWKIRMYNIGLFICCLPIRGKSFVLFRILISYLRKCFRFIRVWSFWRIRLSFRIGIVYVSLGGCFLWLIGKMIINFRLGNLKNLIFLKVCGISRISLILIEIQISSVIKIFTLFIWSFGIWIPIMTSF